MPVDYNELLRLSYLQAAFAAIEDEEDKIALYRDFYAGEQNIYLTDRQKEYLREDFDSFANICKRTVNIVSDRLAIPEDGIEPVDDSSTVYAEMARAWWTDEATSDAGGNFDPYSLQSDVYEAALRDTATAIIVGWDDALGIPTFTPNLIYDGDTGLIRFHYDDNNALLFASKRWTVYNPLKPGDTGKRRLTIYTPGYIERYESYTQSGGGWRLLQPEEINPVNPVPNPQPWTDNGTLSGEPLGIPVIPFENPSGSELDDVIAIQEALNHNLATFDISIDMHGFPILGFFGFNFPIDQTTGYSQIPKLSPASGVATDDTAGHIDRIEPANIKEMFEAGVVSWVQLLALVKGWPMYLFDRNQQPPSGVALTVMEKALVAQVERKQRSFSGAWRAAFNMGRKLHKLKTGQDLPGQIKFNWQPAATKDQQAETEMMRMEFEAGQYPIVTRWRRLGNNADEIEQMLRDKAREDDLGLVDLVTGIEQ